MFKVINCYTVNHVMIWQYNNQKFIVEGENNIGWIDTLIEAKKIARKTIL